MRPTELRVVRDLTHLCRVVSSLQLRDVDDQAGHGCRCDEGSVGEVLELLAVYRRALELLALPMLSSSAGAEKCAVKVGGNDFVVVV